MSCIVENCDRSEKGNGCARGYCAMHYMRWLKYGDPHISKINRQRGYDGCLVSGCKNAHAAKGYCQTHYLRLKKNGSPYAFSPKFRNRAKWIEEHASYDGEDCLKWPFSVSHHGRGAVRFNNRSMSAPRAMCILAHGEPPTEKHQAAHSCGNGHLGCMNPRHISWKTPKENESDKVRHGTLRRGSDINTSKLSQDQVRSIRADLSQGCRGADLAKKYGVTPAMISNIKTKKAWAWLSD